jgi:hypothetical protein
VFVIPAKAGIHLDLAFLLESKSQATAKSKWIPAFAGMTAEGFIAPPPPPQSQSQPQLPPDDALP